MEEHRLSLEIFRVEWFSTEGRMEELFQRMLTSSYTCVETSDLATYFLPVLECHIQTHKYTGWQKLSDFYCCPAYIIITPLWLSFTVRWLEYLSPASHIKENCINPYVYRNKALLLLFSFEWFNLLTLLLSVGTACLNVKQQLDLCVI